MKSAHSAIQGFDWVPVSRVVCIIQIVTICQLRAPNPYILRKIPQDNFARNSQASNSQGPFQECHHPGC
jgi:hypothetical protein